MARAFLGEVFSLMTRQVDQAVQKLHNEAEVLFLPVSRLLVGRSRPHGS